MRSGFLVNEKVRRIWRLFLKLKEEAFMRKQRWKKKRLQDIRDLPAFWEAL